MNVDRFDINWLATYRALGLWNVYSNFVKKQEPREIAGKWTIPVLRSPICNMVIEALRQQGYTVSAFYQDVDGILRQNPHGFPYAVTVPKAFEAIESEAGLAEKSTNDLKESHKGITLPVCLLLKLGCVVSFGLQTDAKGVTLCTGSVSKVGLIPAVYWNPHDRKILIPWHKGDTKGSRIRSRSMSSVPVSIL